MSNNIKLTPHFRLIEFTRSDTAIQKGIDNTPTPEHLDNIQKLAEFLEEVRAMLAHPIIITSGYRSPALNAVIPGSSSTSDHMNGLAADFHCPGYGTPYDVCRRIAASRLKFDQLIFEQNRSTWVHLGLGERQRRDVMSWRSGRGYRAGIVHIN